VERQVIVDLGHKIFHLHCHLVTFHPQALSKVFALSGESGQVQHRPDPSKKGCELAFDLAILLWSLVGRKLEVKAQTFFLCQGLECNIFS